MRPCDVTEAGFLLEHMADELAQVVDALDGERALL
jgi:hypothetical protein